MKSDCSRLGGYNEQPKASVDSSDILAESSSKSQVLSTVSCHIPTSDFNARSHFSERWKNQKEAKSF